MFSKIKPTLVITLICFLASAILIWAYNATYVDNSGVITDEMKSVLAEIYETDEEFTFVKSKNGDILSLGGANYFLQGENGDVAVNVIADGYAKHGLDVLVCFDAEKTVVGVDILAIAETPNLGTRVESEDFLSQYIGLKKEMLHAEIVDTSEHKYVFASSSEIDELKKDNTHEDGVYEFDVISGATYSSNGMKNAVVTAINAIEILARGE